MVAEMGVSEDGHGNWTEVMVGTSRALGEGPGERKSWGRPEGESWGRGRGPGRGDSRGWGGRPGGGGETWGRCGVSIGGGGGGGRRFLRRGRRGGATKSSPSGGEPEQGTSGGVGMATTTMSLPSSSTLSSDSDGVGGRGRGTLTLGGGGVLPTARLRVMSTLAGIGGGGGGVSLPGRLGVPSTSADVDGGGRWETVWLKAGTTARSVVSASICRRGEGWRHCVWGVG